MDRNREENGGITESAKANFLSCRIQHSWAVTSRSAGERRLQVEFSPLAESGPLAAVGSAHRNVVHALVLRPLHVNVPWARLGRVSCKELLSLKLVEADLLVAHFVTGDLRYDAGNVVVGGVFWAEHWYFLLARPAVVPEPTGSDRRHIARRGPRDLPVGIDRPKEYTFLLYRRDLTFVILHEGRHGEAAESGTAAHKDVVHFD